MSYGKYELIIFKVAKWIREKNDFFVREDEILLDDVRHLSIYWKSEKNIKFLFFNFKNINYYFVAKLFLLSDYEWMITETTNSKLWNFDMLIEDLEKEFKVNIVNVSIPSYKYAFDKNFKKSHTVKSSEFQ